MKLSSFQYSLVICLLLFLQESSAATLRGGDDEALSLGDDESEAHQNEQRELNGNLNLSGDRPVEIIPITDEEIPNGVAPEVGTIGHAIPLLNAELNRYQVTQSLRFNNYLSAVWWNCVAAYSTDYKDALTKERPTVYAQDASLHTVYYRSACLAQASATYAELAIPGVNPAFFNFMARHSKISLQRPVSGLVMSCRGRDSCYQQLVSTVGFSPSFMGQIIGKKVHDFSLQDGFNELGTDDCSANCRPYMDTTGYSPMPFPRYREQNDTNKNRWQPLVEDNGRGYFSYQSHITPHVGPNAVFHYLPESERTDRVSPIPDYSDSMASEAQVVLDRMAALDDQKKIQAENFDSKTIMARALTFSFVNKLVDDGYDDEDLSNPIGPHDPVNGYVLSMERFIHFLQTFYAARYDAIIVAWKEKVKRDWIRPTTVIQQMNGTVTTYAPGGGVRTFPAKEFEAYLNVAAHSEYISATACIVTTEKEVLDGYFEGIGLDPSSFPITFGTISAGRSVYEPGVVPADDLTLTYSNMTDYATSGAQSRIDSGAHFEGSVAAGIETCSGIAQYALAGSFDLYG